MFTAECLVAALLLTAPQDAPQDHAWAMVLRPNILALATDAEVLDPREKGFVMGQDLLGDLAMLQGRYAEFSRAPLLAEAERFPDRKLINEYLALNRAYRNQLTQRLAIDLIHAEEIRVALSDTDQLYQIWDAVRDSRCDYYYVTVRRQSLSLLRDLIGAESFYSGRMPPQVPVWHFSRN
jgi:hypothetical protein